MNTCLRTLASLLLCAVLMPAQGQDASAESRFPEIHELRPSEREMTSEEREQWRELRRQRREAWRQMSPEERRQLRRDIRAAGHEVYPRGPKPPPGEQRPD